MITDTFGRRHHVPGSDIDLDITTQPLSASLKGAYTVVTDTLIAWAPKHDSIPFPVNKQIYRAEQAQLSVIVAKGAQEVTYETMFNALDGFRFYLYQKGQKLMYRVVVRIDKAGDSRAVAMFALEGAGPRQDAVIDGNVDTS